MRKLGAGLLAFVLVFAAAACGDDSGSSSSGTGGSGGGNFGDCEITVDKGTLGEVQLTNDGELTVATNLPAPGFWNGDDPDSVNGGFEYCMAADIATSLGLDKVKVVNVSFDALVAGQTAGFDIALSQVTITDERAKVVDFSTPYFSADQGVMVNKGTSVANMDEARAVSWGVQASTTAQTYLTDVIKPAKRSGRLPRHAVDVRRTHREADRRGDARHVDPPRSGRGEQRRAGGRRAVQHRRGVRRHLPKGLAERGGHRQDHLGLRLGRNPEGARGQVARPRLQG